MYSPNAMYGDSNQSQMNRDNNHSNNPPPLVSSISSHLPLSMGLSGVGNSNGVPLSRGVISSISGNMNNGMGIGQSSAPPHQNSYFASAAFLPKIAHPPLEGVGGSINQMDSSMMSGFQGGHGPVGQNDGNSMMHRGLPPLQSTPQLPPHTILPPPQKVFNLTNKAPLSPDDKDDSQDEDGYNDSGSEGTGKGSGKSKRKRTEETAEVRKERHNQAEKKRRSDMNGAIQKLKTMLPEQVTKDKRLTKVDILTETADHLTQVQQLCHKLLHDNKQLRNQLASLGVTTASSGGSSSSGGGMPVGLSLGGVSKTEDGVRLPPTSVLVNGSVGANGSQLNQDVGMGISVIYSREGYSPPGVDGGHYGHGGDKDDSIDKDS